MKEIRMNIPEGSKVVTVNVDGENVITEFEPKWEPQDGDFLTDTLLGTIVIYAGTDKAGIVITHASLSRAPLLEKLDVERGKGIGFTKAHRYATDEEKAKLLDKLAEAGYRWNPDKKELEKLPRWRADVGEDVYYVNAYCDVEVIKDYGSMSIPYKQGNYFRTREAAERVANQIREIFKNSKAE